MPTCDHCDHHVSADWKRLYEIDGSIPVCPHCPDRFPDPKAEGGYRNYRQDHPEHQPDKIATDGGAQ